MDPRRRQICNRDLCSKEDWRIVGAQRQMRLGLNIVANGAHAAGWRMPQAEADALDIRLWKRLAQAAEQARIHFMFWADGIAVRHSAQD